MSAGALFITYDGLLDPLGESQILPYLRSIAAHPRAVHILSFEKPARLEGEAAMRRRLESVGIGWTPVSFTRGGKLAKLKDLFLMYAHAVLLQRRNRFGIVHARSYQAAQVACFLKRVFSIRVIFDMRGLWVDERIDGGLWRMDRLIDRMMYRTYKRVERRLLYCADHVVALTKRVLPELARLAPGMRAGTTVIPCCADFAHFRMLSAEGRVLVRERLGIGPNAFVLTYVGSLGTWYMLEDMIRFFIQAARLRPDICLLVVTRDWEPAHDRLVVELGGAEFKGRVKVVSASRDEVPSYLGASDVMLSFIKPAYSKMASSPTKLAEAYACGIPTICNAGIGDVDAQLAELHAGAIVDLANPDQVADIIARLEAIRLSGGEALRNRAGRQLDLSVAVDAYRRIYDSI